MSTHSVQLSATPEPGHRVIAWAAHADHGAVLFDTLGSTPLLGALQAAAAHDDQAAVDRLMRAAVAALVRLQIGVPADSLPPFDAARLASELALFPEWCVRCEFGVAWTDAQQTAWQRVCGLLVDGAVAQPVVAVHADWTPRKLVVLPAVGDAVGVPAVVGVQDAVAGPISYDLVSLLRDAAMPWDEAQELDWAVRWWQQARTAGLPVDPDFGAFWQALEWMGLQRHFKLMGAACRRKHRDGDAADAAELPRFFGYVNKVALRYRPLQPLLALLEPLSGTRVEAGFTF